MRLGAHAQNQCLTFASRCGGFETVKNYNRNQPMHQRRRGGTLISSSLRRALYCRSWHLYRKYLSCSRGCRRNHLSCSRSRDRCGQIRLARSVRRRINLRTHPSYHHRQSRVTGWVQRLLRRIWVQRIWTAEPATSSLNSWRRWSRAV